MSRPITPWQIVLAVLKRETIVARKCHERKEKYKLAWVPREPPQYRLTRQREVPAAIAADVLRSLKVRIDEQLGKAGS